MMYKKTITFILTFMLILTFGISALAEKSVPTTIERPSSLNIRDDGGIFYLIWTNPKSIIQTVRDTEDGEYDANLYYVFDWKKNDGNWNVGVTYDEPGYTEEIHGYFYGNMPNVQIDENGTTEAFFVTWHLDPNASPSSSFDLANNTYYFRMRYVLTPYDNEFPIRYSPYSDEVAIGKNANTKKITHLDPPKDLKVEVKKDINNKPYFQLNWTIPESINEADKQFPVYHRIDFKVGNGKWISESGGWDSMAVAPSEMLMASDTLDPVEKQFVGHVIIEENTYYFRVAFEGEPNSSDSIFSNFSNIASTKMPAYSDASNWAKPELDKAAEYDLIPISLKGADMTKNITREEFAELAVRLYERTTGKAAVPVAKNPFKDTNNPEVLKALNLDITKGVSADKFAPKDLINREQVATMLSRAIRTMVPNGDFSITGALTFNDEKHISSWALEHVKYMSKNGIIKGADGNFMPKATTTAQIASGYANTTREQAILMGVRTFEKYKVNN